VICQAARDPHGAAAHREESRRGFGARQPRRQLRRRIERDAAFRCVRDAGVRGQVGNGYTRRCWRRNDQSKEKILQFNAIDTVLLAPWSSLFSSAASVSATLIGFAAVALSVNLQQILTSPWLVLRAAQALIRLVSALLLSLLMQMPDSQHGFRTAAIIVLMLGFKVWATLIDARKKRPTEHISRRSALMLLVSGQLVSLAFLLTGILLWLNQDAAAIVAVAGILGAILLTTVDTWVLLVEILR